MDLEPKYAGRFEESLETTKTISSHSDKENILNNKTEVKSLLNNVYEATSLLGQCGLDYPISFYIWRNICLSDIIVSLLYYLEANDKEVR